MLLAPWRQHGDHAQAHREAAGGEDEECEDGGEGSEAGIAEDLDAQGVRWQEDVPGDEGLDEQTAGEEGFDERIVGEEDCEQRIHGEEGVHAEEGVEPYGEAAGGVQPEA